MEIVDVIITGIVMEDTGVNAVHAAASGAAGVKRKAQAISCPKEEDCIDLTGVDGGKTTVRPTDKPKGRTESVKRLATNAKAQTASKGGSSSAGVSSGKKSSQEGNQDKFNKNEIAYADTLWPLLDVDGDGEVTLEAFERVIAKARTKGFSAVMSKRDVCEMFYLGARENGRDVLTKTDVKQIVKDTKMHHKR
jgi:hypothetical protein